MRHHGPALSIEQYLPKNASCPGIRRHLCNGQRGDRANSLIEIAGTLGVNVGYAKTASPIIIGIAGFTVEHSNAAGQLGVGDYSLTKASGSVADPR
jgi:hypothetical protein